jgi:hypothetical protein
MTRLLDAIRQRQLQYHPAAMAGSAVRIGHPDFIDLRDHWHLAPVHRAGRFKPGLLTCLFLPELMAQLHDLKLTAFRIPVGSHQASGWKTCV